MNDTELMNMKIGIIGTGNIGATLARKLLSAGHEVKIANSGGVKGVQSVADDIGAVPADVHGAVDGVDVVVLAIPLPAMASLPAGLFDGVPPQVTVIDTSNYYPGMRDAAIAQIDAGMAESVWVSAQLGRPVVKAFNNVLAHTLAALGQPAGTPGRLAIAVAGDDPMAMQAAMTLVEQAGFDAVDGGTLAQSWRQQPCTPAYCCDLEAPAMARALAAAVPGKAAAIRDRMPAQFAKLGAHASHDDIVAMNRQLNV
nr:NAD(P)-binding domain-containing protein [Janthinobacterium lividum]